MSQPTNILLLIRSFVDVHFGTNDKMATKKPEGRGEGGIEAQTTNNVARKRWKFGLYTSLHLDVWARSF